MFCSTNQEYLNTLYPANDSSKACFVVERSFLTHFCIIILFISLLSTFLVIGFLPNHNGCKSSYTLLELVLLTIEERQQ